MLLVVEPTSKVMVESLRKAVNALSTSAGEPNAPVMPSLAAQLRLPAAPAPEAPKPAATP